jgi:serine/threonine protein kinase/tetratricopeptide (TPR) repeat protein
MTAPTPSITQTRFGAPGFDRATSSPGFDRDASWGEACGEACGEDRGELGPCSEPTIDDAELSWLSQVDDSDEGGPLRLTLARVPRASAGGAADPNGADAGQDHDGWQPLGEHVRLASGRRVPGTRYRIVRWLGEGGMGVVFEALHVDIQRPVALKILKPGVAGSELQRERFVDEARAVASVESRFVVDVLDFGELPDGRPFYTMELLDPVSLANELRAGPMPLVRALPILRQCCKALAAVHERGLAHRDVKPQNVLLQHDDGRADAVRVVDFGIAAKFSSHPRIAGTAMYMAPEQIRGISFDGRVDIYGLGCVAFELLTGVPPFEGTSAAEVVQRHLHDPPPSARVRVPTLSPGLDLLLQRCLAKQPEDRFPDMHALEAALCELQIAGGFTTPWDDLPLPTLPETQRAELRRRMPQPRGERPRLGSRLRPVAVAVAVGLASAGAVLVSAQPSTSSPATSSAASPGSVHGEADATSHQARFEMAMAAIRDKTEAARVAGSRAYWAYPPASDPDYPTALRMIGALERERGPLRHLAQLRASDLRDEFAETLIRLGDQYWSAPHGRPFALEFYAQALLFDAEAPRARERASLTPAQLADVARRARAGEFSPLELDIGAALSALADEDPARRREHVTTLLASGSPLASSIRFRPQLEAVVGIEAGSEAGSEAGAGVEDPAPPEPSAPEPESRTPSKPSATASSSERARQTLSKAEAALRKGERDRAERLFDKALAHADTLDASERARAYAGLAELQFARGRYQEAMSAARRATQARPRDASLQLLLGDACLKTLRYTDARAAYEKARTLGHDKAAQRLAQLDEVAR